MFIELLAIGTFLSVAGGKLAATVGVVSQALLGIKAEHERDAFLGYFKEGFNPVEEQSRAERAGDPSHRIPRAAFIIDREVLLDMRRLYQRLHPGETLREVDEDLEAALCGRYALTPTHFQAFITAAEAEFRRKPHRCDFEWLRITSSAVISNPSRYGEWKANRFGAASGGGAA